jgi:hypothetical protein
MLPFGSSGWRLCDRSDCRGGDRLAVTVSQAQARAWLVGFSRDLLKVGAWRGLLKRATARPIEQETEDAVIDAVAGLLAQGRIHIHAKPHEPLVARVVNVPAGAPPPAPPAPRPAPKPALRISAGNAPLLDVNMSLQAAALVAAANQGAPFCPL